MNCYATVGQVREKLNTSTTLDASVLACLEAASRAVDAASGRNGTTEGFWIETGVRYFSGDCGGIRQGRMYIDECLALTEIAEDTGADATYSTVWDNITDYLLAPANTYPKCYVELHQNSAQSLGFGKRRYKLTGTWGYGDGTSNPWKSAGVTGTVATTSGTALTLSAAGAPAIDAGHTLKIDTEQLFVESVSGTTATVTRAVNGTTAATHTTAAVYIAQYPRDVVLASMWFAIEMWKNMQSAGLSGERIGNYSYTTATPEITEQQKRRMLGRVQRWA